MTNSMAMPKPKYRINQERLDKMMAFIREHWQEYHFSPGTREIAAHLNISTSVVAYYRTHLEKTGFLETHPAGMSRAYVPVEIFKDRPVFPEGEPITMGKSMAVAIDPAEFGVDSETKYWRVSGGDL